MCTLLPHVLLPTIDYPAQHEGVCWECALSFPMYCCPPLSIQPSMMECVGNGLSASPCIVAHQWLSNPAGRSVLETCSFLLHKLLLTTVYPPSMQECVWNMLFSFLMFCCQPLSIQPSSQECVGNMHFPSPCTVAYHCLSNPERRSVLAICYFLPHVLLSITVYPIQDAGVCSFPPCIVAHHCLSNPACSNVLGMCYFHPHVLLPTIVY